MKVLGVDPGYDRIGIAIVDGSQKTPILIHSECFETDRKKDVGERIYNIGTHLKNIIETMSPERCSLESVFFFKNQKTVMGVAEVCGVIRYLSYINTIPVAEYTPREVKQIVTGDGAADKKQVEKMLRLIIPTVPHDVLDDEYDAIALALSSILSPK